MGGGGWKTWAQGWLRVPSLCGVHLSSLQTSALPGAKRPLCPSPRHLLLGHSHLDLPAQARRAAADTSRFWPVLAPRVEDQWGARAGTFLGCPRAVAQCVVGSPSHPTAQGLSGCLEVGPRGCKMGFHGGRGLGLLPSPQKGGLRARLPTGRSQPGLPVTGGWGWAVSRSLVGQMKSDLWFPNGKVGRKRWS